MGLKLRVLWRNGMRAGVTNLLIFGCCVSGSEPNGTLAEFHIRISSTLVKSCWTLDHVTSEMPKKSSFLKSYSIGTFPSVSFPHQPKVFLGQKYLVPHCSGCTTRLVKRITSNVPFNPWISLVSGPKYQVFPRHYTVHTTCTHFSSEINLSNLSAKEGYLDSIVSDKIGKCYWYTII